MNRKRWLWVAGGATGVIVAQGTRVSVYNFKVEGLASKAIFTTGGAGGEVLNNVQAGDVGRNDPVDGANGYIEFYDGVYVTVTGSPLAVGVQVSCGEDPP